MLSYFFTLHPENENVDLFLARQILQIIFRRISGMAQDDIYKEIDIEVDIDGGYLTLASVPGNTEKLTQEHITDAVWAAVYDDPHPEDGVLYSICGAYRPFSKKPFDVLIVHTEHQPRYKDDVTAFLCRFCAGGVGIANWQTPEL